MNDLDFMFISLFIIVTLVGACLIVSISIAESQKEMFCISEHLYYSGNNACSDLNIAYPIISCQTNSYGYCFVKEKQ